MYKKNKFLMILKIATGICAFILILGFGTMHLWNWLIPVLFHGPIINFTQSIGLLILAKILFGGFGKHHHRGDHWKHKMRGCMHSLSPEEQEIFKQRMKEKCRNKFWMKSTETPTL